MGIGKHVRHGREIACGEQGLCEIQTPVAVYGRGANAAYLFGAGLDHAAPIAPASDVAQARDRPASRGQDERRAHRLRAAGEVDHDVFRRDVLQNRFQHTVEMCVGRIRVVLVAGRQRRYFHRCIVEPVPQRPGEVLGDGGRQQHHSGPGIGGNRLPQRREQRFFEPIEIAGPYRYDHRASVALWHPLTSPASEWTLSRVRCRHESVVTGWFGVTIRWPSEGDLPRIG